MSPAAPKTAGTAQPYGGHARRSGGRESPTRATTSGGRGVGLPRGAGRHAERAQPGQGGRGAGRATVRVGIGEPAEQPAQPAVGRGGAGWPTGQQLGRDDPGGVQVLPRVGRGARRLLGRHVAAGADASRRARQPRVAGHDRDAEVAEPDPRPAGAGGLEQEVARLDVAVHHAGRVHRDERLEDLLQHHADVRVGQGTVPLQQLLEVPAAHEVHREEGAARTVGRLDDVPVPHAQRRARGRSAPARRRRTGPAAWPRPSGVRGGPTRARPCPCRRRRPGRSTGSGCGCA